MILHLNLLLRKLAIAEFGQLSVGYMLVVAVVRFHVFQNSHIVVLGGHHQIAVEHKFQLQNLGVL